MSSHSLIDVTITSAASANPGGAFPALAAAAFAARPAARVGQPISTFTGKPFWPLDPRVEDVDVLNIAHHLSMRCRFNGALYDFYSVAQHSVLVSRQAYRFAKQNGATPDECVTIALYGLWHDASEAYLSDIIRPLKYSERLRFWVPEIEEPVQRVCYQAIGLNFDDEPALVRQCDDLMLDAEFRDLAKHPDAVHARRADAMRVNPIRPKDNRAAKLLFLERFVELDQARRGVEIFA